MTNFPTTASVLTAGHLQTIARALTPLATNAGWRFGMALSQLTLPSSQCRSGLKFYGTSEDIYRKFHYNGPKDAVCRDVAGVEAWKALTLEIKAVFQAVGIEAAVDYRGGLPIWVTRSDHSGTLEQYAQWWGVALYFSISDFICRVAIVTKPHVAQDPFPSALTVRPFLPRPEDGKTDRELRTLILQKLHARSERDDSECDDMVGIFPTVSSAGVGLRYYFPVESLQGPTELLANDAIIARATAMVTQRFHGPAAPREVAPPVQVTWHTLSRGLVLTDEDDLVHTLGWAGLNLRQVTTNTVTVSNNTISATSQEVYPRRPEAHRLWRALPKRNRGAVNERDTVRWMWCADHCYAWERVAPVLNALGLQRPRTRAAESCLLDAVAQWWGEGDAACMVDILSA